MANNLVAIQTKIIANLAVQTLSDTLILTNFVRKDISAEEVSENEEIKIVLNTKDFVSKEFTHEAGIQKQGITTKTLSIKVDRHRDVSFSLTEKELLEVGVKKLLEAKFQEAVQVLGEEINTHGYSLYKNVYQFSGSGTENKYKEDDIRNATRVLSKSNVTKGKVSLVNSDAFYDIVGETVKFANIDLSTNAFVEASLPAVGGAPLLQDTLLNNIRHTAGTATGKAVTVKTAATAGSSSIVLTTEGATDTLVHGDLLEISGKQYVVMADAVAVSNDITVQVSPEIIEDIEADVAVTTVESHDVNLMFAPSFAVFVMRPLADAAKKLGFDSKLMMQEIVTDPRTGVSFRYSMDRDFDHKSFTVSVDVLYAFEMIDSRFACRILNS